MACCCQQPHPPSRNSSARRGLGRDILFVLTMEPLRFLTGWFLHYSSPLTRQTRTCFKYPPLCTLVSHMHSPVIAVMEYLSAMLSGVLPRLRLLWGRGFKSFSEWASARPKHLQALRSGVTTAGSWHFRIIVAGMHGMGWPWRLALLVFPPLP